MIVVVPAATVVTKPLALTVATCTLLESHVTWLVRLCEPPTPVRFPVAVSCVVSPANVSATVFGITEIEGAPEAAMDTLRVELALSPPDSAMIVVVPEPTAVANPAELMVATCTLLDTHVTRLVRFCMAPMSVRLPVAVNCVVSPAKVSATELGTTVSVGVPDPDPEAGTVTVRDAAALSPPDTAVIVVVPAPTDVASPAELIVATCALLEIHVTVLVRFWGPPMPVKLPLAINCVVSPAKVSAATFGVTVIDGVPVPVLEMATVTVALALSPPYSARTVVVPAPTAVASPLELTVATCALLESHVT
jgi:hypothetical protein